LKKADGTEVETVRLPYEENEFLDYLDMQQLPPLLVDVLDTAQVNIYHDGCVIVELRDYRRSNLKTVDATFLLLKPTSQTIVRDVNAMMPDSSKWTTDDKLLLESKLTLLNNRRLCLDPSPEVFNSTSRIQYYANKFNHKGLKRSMKRFSQPYLNRAMLCSNTPSPPCLKLLDFIQRHRDKRTTNTFHKLNRATQHTDMWKQRPSELKMPVKIDVQSYAKMHEQPKYTTDYTPEKIQEIILEGEKTNNRSYYCRVTIQRRGSTGEYIGDLYLEEDHGVAKEETHKDGRACKFSLGNRLTAQRYLQQFQELYTEEGRKSVKISTYVANGQHKQQQSSQRQTTVTTQSTPTPVQSSRSYTPATTATTSESTLTVNLSRTFAQAQAQNSMMSQGNTYILASSVPGLQQPINIGSNIVMSLSSSLAQSLVSGNATFSVSGSPYFVNASGNLQQAFTSKTLQSPSNNKLSANQMIGNENGVQFTTAYIQPIVSGSSMSVSTHGQLTAVPIAMQGNNVSIVPGNVNAQFIAKAAHQAIRPAGSNNQIMLQNVASAQMGQRLQASFAMPGNLVPISQVARVGTHQKGQLNSPGMASLMVHGKQVMVQGQATFIPSQGPIIPGLQTGQAAIIQGGSIFLQGQPGQSIVGGQAQAQAVMIQGQAGQAQTNQNALLQSQSLQGQAVFIQGQPGTNQQGQTIMLQNQSGHQGQFQIISTTANSSGLQIVPQLHQKQGASTTSQARGHQSTALSALTSQVNLIPVQQGAHYQNVVHFSQQPQQAKPVTQRRRSSNQSSMAANAKKKLPVPNKPSPTG